MEIYIKPRKKASLAEVGFILVKDVSEVLATTEMTKTIKDLKIIDIDMQKKGCYLVSVTDIVKTIKKKYPDVTVNNLGEPDTFVDYSPVKSHEKKVITWLKIIFISMVLFVGSATAIMSFHNDAQMPRIFENIFFILFGYENDKPLILEIPYSLGLSAGIIIFFNHFIGKKLTDDPTPIEVQMSAYEDEVSNAIIDLLDLEKLKKEQGDAENGGG